MTRSAPSRKRAGDRELADRAAPQTATTSPGLDVAHLRAHVAGRKDVGQEQHLFVGHAVVDLERADVGERHARVLGLAAGEAAEHVRVAEDAARRVAPRASRPSTRWGSSSRTARSGLRWQAQQCAAGDREGHDDAVADLQVRHRRPDLDDLAHELVAEDVALLHRRDEAVVEVQIGAADRGRGDLHDRVAAS